MTEPTVPPLPPPGTRHIAGRDFGPGPAARAMYASLVAGADAIDEAAASLTGKLNVLRAAIADRHTAAQARDAALADLRASHRAKRGGRR